MRCCSVPAPALSHEPNRCHVSHPPSRLPPRRCRGATPRDFRVLPRRIFLVRHAESEGNVDNIAYTYLPDPRVPLTARGWQQVRGAGASSRRMGLLASQLQRPDCLAGCLAAAWTEALPFHCLLYLLCLQAMVAGDRMKLDMEAASGGKPYKLFFYTSPYLRSRQVRCSGGCLCWLALRNSCCSSYRWSDRGDWG